jgi:23S rRNA-/tRNA-specific pseudouridylate synthase
MAVDGGRWVSPVAGRPAATRFQVLERGADATLLELVLETGRYHQIRVHAAAAGHPILGDRRHGGPPFDRLLLHAHQLGLRHPQTEKPMAWQALPDWSWTAECGS